ncbi:hypothetical protein EB796_023475 [Bugula neritina]|uniref:Uncharacterized protein n=1 Tax=Bugula neritina TaxID=10212 RepID=A0A7J7IXY0_BUGNE|nr:hypothetical protein EB796_023475 [Bugula neritina]
MEWKTEVLPVITPGCLNCIRTVELNKPVDPAVLGDCIIHDWPKALRVKERHVENTPYQSSTMRDAPAALAQELEM